MLDDALIDMPPALRAMKVDYYYYYAAVSCCASCHDDDYAITDYFCF